MIKVIDIAYVWYRVSDLDKTEQFMKDYGLVTAAKTDTMLFMRGRNKAQPYCYVGELSSTPGLVSVGLKADPAANLADATKLPGASAIEEVSWIGGGRRVSVTSPGGIRFDVMSGVADAEELPSRGPVEINVASHISRAKKVLRLERKPAEVLRLGHVALATTNPKGTMDFMEHSFGMIVSDYVMAPDGSDACIGGFIRVNRGDTLVDHHAIGVFISKRDGVHHYSLEVEDFDDLQMGGMWMESKGYRRHWGIGRHILGSNMFDYWLDPDGNRAEHFTDMDMFDASEPTGRSLATIESLCSWGPPLPKSFLWVDPAAPVSPDAQVLSLE